MYVDSVAPTNYLYCNGADISRTTYSALFAIIGVKYGYGDNSTTFNLPDMRGVFPRGFNDTASDAFLDPNRTSRISRYTGGATGNNIGSY